jgi:hypothetical protein
MDQCFQEKVLNTRQHNVFYVAYQCCITSQSALKILQYEGHQNTHYAHCQNVSDDLNETNVTNNSADRLPVEHILSIVRMC